MNHKKCRPRLEEGLSSFHPEGAWHQQPNKCGIIDHQFGPLHLLQQQGCGQSRTCCKAEPSHGEQDTLPCCAGQVWSCPTAPCSPGGLCSLKAKPRSHTPVSQSPRARLGQESATRRVATRVPQHPLDWEQQDGEVRKVQTRYSPAKTPDWSHWQHIPPRQELGRWRACTKREIEV